MEELKIDEPIQMSAEQFKCPSCEKKFYINIEDFNEEEVLDCPFCNVMDVRNIRQFELSITKIFTKE